MIKVKIMTLSHGPVNSFMDYNFAKEDGFNLADYNTVYTCYRNDDYNPEKAFYEFNRNRPSDYNGHSLSISDVVEIGGRAFYCDNFGWVEVKAPLKKIFNN